MNDIDPNLLLEKAKKGDEEASSLLYSSFYTPLYRFILQRVKHVQTAEDLTQTVFCKFFQKVDSIENQYPRSYLFTIAKHTLIDYWKKKKDVTFNEAESFLYIEDDRQSSQERVLQGEYAEMVETGLSKLEGEQRLAIEMKFLEQLSNKEIAEILQKKEATVRQIQCRALKKLRTYFGSQNI